MITIYERNDETCDGVNFIEDIVKKHNAVSVQRLYVGSTTTMGPWAAIQQGHMSIPNPIFIDDLPKYKLIAYLTAFLVHIHSHIVKYYIVLTAASNANEVGANVFVPNEQVIEQVKFLDVREA